MKRSLGKQEIVETAVKAVGDCILVHTEATHTRALDAIRNQAITTNLNMGKMKARTSLIGEALERLEKTTDGIDCRLSFTAEIKELSVSIVSAAKRIQGSAECMEVAVNGFKGGIFTLLQRLLDWQNLLTNQMAVQAKMFQELMKAFQKERVSMVRAEREEQQNGGKPENIRSDKQTKQSEQEHQRRKQDEEQKSTEKEQRKVIEKRKQDFEDEGEKKSEEDGGKTVKKMRKEAGN